MDGTDVVDPDELTDTGAEAEAEAEHLETAISAHTSAPDRVVFIEDGNSDGWIALDVDWTVSLER